MDVDCAGSGAAKRRRDRHVKMTGAMELATALHHSAQPAGLVVGGPREVDVHEKYYAPRGPKTPPPGMRPAPLPRPALVSEAAGPQGAAVTVCSRSGRQEEGGGEGEGREEEGEDACAQHQGCCRLAAH